MAVLLLIYLLNKYSDISLEWAIVIGVLFVVLNFLSMYAPHIAKNKVGNAAANYMKLPLILILTVLVLLSSSEFYESVSVVSVMLLIALPVLGIPIQALVMKMARSKTASEDKGVHMSSLAPSVKAKSTLVAGIGSMAVNVEKHLQAHSKTPRHIKGFIKCKKEESVVTNDRIIGDLESIHSYLSENPVDEIVIALPVKPSKKVKSIIEVADYHGIRVKYVPDYQGLLGTNYKITRYGHIDAINVRQVPLDDPLAFWVKNSFDKVFAFLALVALSPLFLVIALLIKLDSPGPLFYCPIRTGKAGKQFRIYKFRSMRCNDDESKGTLSTKQNDERITKVGKVLRKYSLDELPQFLNVLLGDMSVVGPRPHRNFLNKQFQISEKRYMVRHYFKPGITGWAQINGWRGPTETQEQKSQRTLHDLWYIENWTLWLDMKIIYLTIFGRKTHQGAF